MQQVNRSEELIPVQEKYAPDNSGSIGIFQYWNKENETSGRR